MLLENRFFSKVLGLSFLMSGLMMFCQQNAYATCDGEECYSPSEFLGWSKNGKYYAISKRCVDESGPEALFVFDRTRGLVHVLHSEGCELYDIAPQVTQTLISPPRKQDSSKPWEWHVRKIDVTRNKFLQKYDLQPVQAAWRQAFKDKELHLNEGVSQKFVRTNLSPLNHLFPSRYVDGIRTVLTKQDKPRLEDVTCTVQTLLAREGAQIGRFIAQCGGEGPGGIFWTEIVGGYVHPVSGDILIKTLLHEDRAATAETFDFIPNPAYQ